MAKVIDGDDYTYDKHLPPQTGSEILHAEIKDLRAQVAQLAEVTLQLAEATVLLAQRVTALEQAQRPRPVAVSMAYDWED